MQVNSKPFESFTWKVLSVGESGVGTGGALKRLVDVATPFVFAEVEAVVDAVA